MFISRFTANLHIHIGSKSEMDSCERRFVSGEWTPSILNSGTGLSSHNMADEQPPAKKPKQARGKENQQGAGATNGKKKQPGMLTFVLVICTLSAVLCIPKTNLIPYSLESPPMGAASYFLTKWGWALFRVFPHSTLKERPPLFTYTSSAIHVALWYKCTLYVRYNFKFVYGLAGQQQVCSKSKKGKEKENKQGAQKMSKEKTKPKGTYTE